MNVNEQIKVENSPFARDKVSKAILNTNDRERELYLIRRRALQEKDDRIDSLEKRLEALEKDMRILKSCP